MISNTKGWFLPTERIIFFRRREKDCLLLGRDVVPRKYARVFEKGSSRKLSFRCIGFSGTRYFVCVPSVPFALKSKSTLASNPNFATFSRLS